MSAQASPSTEVTVAAAADAFTTEVIRNAVVAITGEMKQNLKRTAYSLVIYEAEDFTVGLFDADGNTVSIGLGLPTFIGPLRTMVKAMIEHWGKENLHQGDILLSNDVAIHGSHQNHLIFVAPVFVDDEIVAFTATQAHWVDIGGLPSIPQSNAQRIPMGHDIWSEGICIPFVKYSDGGAVNEWVTNLIFRNVRNPKAAMGDLRAQLAALRTGERRTQDLVGRYGTDAWRSAIEQIFDNSEQLARAAVRAMTPGVYEAEEFLDDDGVTKGVPLPFKVKVIVEGDEITVDWSEMAPQTAGNLNQGMAAGIGTTQVAFKMLTTPLQYPINDGAFRPLKVILPPGKINSASPDAAVFWWLTVNMTEIDVIWKALAPAAPHRVPAGHFASGEPGGWGAKFDSDGNSASHNVNDGDAKIVPVEALENNRGVIIGKRALRRDSGGPGEFRGGLGTEIKTTYKTAGFYTSVMERSTCAPHGLFEGHEGSPNRFGIVRANGEETWYPNDEHKSTKVQMIEMRAGDSVVQEFGGGGGYGDPKKRDPERVLADVTNDYVSIGSARDDYGVAIVGSPAAGFSIDEAATAALRG